MILLQNSTLAPLVLYPASSETDNEQNAGQDDEVIMQNFKFPNVLVTVERMNSRKSEEITMGTLNRSKKPKGGKRENLESAILRESKMSEARKNKTPCSAKSDCDKEPKKKKVLKEKEDPQVASKTRALTSFFSPLQNTSNAKKESVTSLTEEERRTKLVMIYTNRVERALNTFDKVSLLKVIKEIVKLPEENIEKIANPFVKFVAQRECVHLKNMEAMKENYLKVQPNKEFEALVLQFLSGKREDMLCELKPFYDVPLMKFCNSNVACTLFGHCLSLTEFLDTFNEFLGHELSFSAVFLMDELKAGKSGFQGCIGYILKAFLHFLINDGYKKKCKQLQSFALQTYVPGVFGILKLTQLVLLDDVYSEGSVDGGAKPKEDEHDTTVGRRSIIGYDANVDRAMQQLQEVAFFWNLAISSQVTIMEILQDKIIDSASFRKYLDSSKEIRARALQEKKGIEDTMQKVQKDIEEIQSHCLEEDMSCLTRKQTKELAENEKLKSKKASELEQLRDKLLEQDGYIQEAETISSYGQVAPLGYDRFYRRYWFFGNSPNRGIFIEQEASCSSQDFSELVISESKDNKSFASFLTSLNENLFGRPPDSSSNKKAEWRVIRTEKELHLLLDCLGKGVREEKLAANIRHHLNDIILSLKEDTETEANDGLQAVAQVDPLNSDSDAKAYQMPEVPEQKQTN
uniref:WHIM2 domain-containing protein n=1 Tax=Ditylenchus dipsaci TaxID=166011 RepID=A0A915CPV4_9BILA